jgi:hypothetical protein
MKSAKVYLMKQPMQKQEDPFNLQSLPSVPPPRDGWPVIEAALRRGQQRRLKLRYAGGALAVAASVTLALGLLLQQPVSDPAESAPEQSLARTLPSTQVQPGAVGIPTATPAADTLESLITLSQRLEGRLRALRSGVGDLPAETVVYQVELEDLVAQVDEELSSRPDSLPLWSQRVSLLMDLDRLYENRLRREYQQMASL